MDSWHPIFLFLVMGFSFGMGALLVLRNHVEKTAADFGDEELMQEVIRRTFARRVKIVANEDVIKAVRSVIDELEEKTYG